MRAILFACGATRLRFSRESATEGLDLCFSMGLSHTDFSVDEEGNVFLTLPRASARRLLEAARARSLSVSVAASYGLPALLSRLVRHLGLLVGGVLGVILLLLSGRFLWAVEVTGNERMSSGEVRELLADCGFFVGRYLPGTDTRAIETRALIATDRIAWLSIHLDGTVARVQVVERVAEEPAPTRPASLVAARDGQIERLEVLRGESAVRVGEAVRAGELLVSGILEGEGIGCRFTRAAGQVWARTERTVSIEIPYAREEKVYQDAKTAKITLNFFNFSLKIFENSGNAGEDCDIIKTEEVFPTRGGRAVPITLEVLRRRSYTTEERMRSEEEALALAYVQLEEELRALSEAAMLLGKEIVTTVGETGIRLDCTVLCIEDIASVCEFDVVQ